MRVGFAYNPSHYLHDTGLHVENVARINNTINYLKNQSVYRRLEPIEARTASYEDLVGVHSAEYVSFIRSLSAAGGGSIDSDTLMAPGSFEAAVQAAGTAVEIVESVLDKRVDYAMALIRPPGHHASKDKAMGFCLFNNIAIATKHAISKHNLERVAIIDIDVHHGNGTQSIFYDSSEVLYISTHQYPLFPGTGNIMETGDGQGRGYTLNIPLPYGCGDIEFLLAFDQVVIPAVIRFRPQLIMVSLGYDTHWEEDLAGMYMTIKGITKLLDKIKCLADDLCQSKMAMVLEGGYPTKVLQAGVTATLELLSDGTPLDTLGDPIYSAKPTEIESLLYTIRKISGLDKSSTTQTV